MNLKFADIFRKGLTETLRDRRQFMFLLGFPVVLIAIFAFAFGSGSFLSGGSLPHQIVVINNDAGVKLLTNNTTQYTNYGADFRGVLQNATAQNSTEHLFHLNNVTQAKAEDLLKSRSVDAVVIMPKNFSAGITTMVNNSTRAAITSSIGQQVLAGAGNGPGAGASAVLPQPGNASSQLVVEGDSGYVNFLSSQGLISAIFEQYKNDVKAQAMTAASSGQPQNLFNDSTPVLIQPIAGTQSFSFFDYMVPGLIVFALLLQISVVAGSLLRDVEKGTLDRLKLSRVSSFDLLFGTFTLWTVITAGQVLVLLAIAMFLGYHYQGGLSSLALALLIGVIAGMASISLALIVASFTTNERQAASVAAMLSMPLGFLAGAFIPLPRQVLVEYGGHTYQLYDLLPWTWAIAALRSVLTYGSGLSADVALDMVWLIALAAILFVVGVVIYASTRLKAQG
ncbi:MAG TPA: ABC transporter permease [Candidatus Acidoferrales bacterium]|nr:ABC transporter permease [Candidatus Acidoferrales bacterium]